MALSVKAAPYNATGNGTTDDTAAFQHALNDAGADGDVVFAPPGVYRIEGTLTVPPYVTLEGVWRSPPYCDKEVHVPALKGTILYVFAGRGTEDGDVFITLTGPHSGLKGLTIFYPEQAAPNLTGRRVIQAYPPTVRGGAPGVIADNLTIQDVLIVNPYSAVDFARNYVGRHLIKGLCGQPLRVGIQVDHCFDVGRIEDVHFWTFWDGSFLVKEFTTTQGVAVVMRESDWQIVNNFYGCDYHSGILFGNSLPLVGAPPTAGPLPGCNGQFSNINFAADVSVFVPKSSERRRRGDTDQ
jgi:Pectate lyase superfamily protein